MELENFKEYFHKILDEGKNEGVYFFWGDEEGEADIVTVAKEKPKTKGKQKINDPDRYAKIDRTEDGKKVGGSDYIVFGWRLDNGTVCSVGKTKEEAAEDFYKFMQDEDNHLVNYDSELEGNDWPFEKSFSYPKVIKWMKKQITDRDFNAAYALLNMADLPSTFKQSYICK